MEKPAPLETALTRLLKIDYPIIAAPMFLISDAKLTTAVCEAGATGAFPALNFRPVEEVRKEIRKVKAATKGPFGINIIAQDSNKYREAHIDICLEEGVSYIISSLGNPASLIQRAHAQGVKVFCDVVSEKHARKAVDVGADALIAVCSGAGGHAGTTSAFALVPQLKASFQVPIIAAGSIVNGQTMLAAMALGADGVYVGTRFIASKEADAPDVYKTAITKLGIEDIVNTDRVDGFPGNFIVTEEFKSHVKEPGFFEKLLRLSPSLEKKWRLYQASSTLFGSPAKLKASYKTVFSAGHGIALIDDVRDARSIVYSLVHEYRQSLLKLSQDAVR